MAPILAMPTEPEHPFTNPEDPHISAILEILKLPAVTSTNSIEDIEACRGAIECLRTSFALSHTNQQGLTVKRIAYTFLIFVSERFLDLFANCHPIALVIMAHHCVLLNMMSSAWFMADKAAQMLQVIQDRLEPRWHKFIEWPVSVIGYHYDTSVDGFSPDDQAMLTPP